MVPRGILGSFSKIFSRMDFRMEKVALWEMDRAREYRLARSRNPCQGHGAPGQVEREFLSAGQQAENDLGGGEVRSHAAQHPHHSGQESPGSSCRAAPPPVPTA